MDSGLLPKIYYQSKFTVFIMKWFVHVSIHPCMHACVQSDDFHIFSTNLVDITYNFPLFRLFSSFSTEVSMKS